MILSEYFAVVRNNYLFWNAFFVFHFFEMQSYPQITNNNFAHPVSNTNQFRS